MVRAFLPKKNLGSRTAYGGSSERGAYGAGGCQECRREVFQEYTVPPSFKMEKFSVLHMFIVVWANLMVSTDQKWIIPPSFSMNSPTLIEPLCVQDPTSPKLPWQMHQNSNPVAPRRQFINVLFISEYPVRTLVWKIRKSQSHRLCKGYGGLHSWLMTWVWSLVTHWGGRVTREWERDPALFMNYDTRFQAHR